jgi:RHS repeat-associated protein
MLSSTGTASSVFGYSGEETDTYLKLLFLRARYYSPETARFLSKDVWQGDYTRPQSLNAWVYTEGNPINRVDPTGNFAEEQCSSPDFPGICVLCELLKRADLTQWLVDEMNANRRGAIAETIRQKISLGHLPLGLGIGHLGDALLDFEDVVHDHGLWDFKYKIEEIVGFNIKLGNVWYNADVPGNIHFGYLGVEVGFTKEILHCGADYATDKTLCSGSDDPEDYEAVEAGADVSRYSSGGDVTAASLRAALAAHPNMRLGEPTIPRFMSLAVEWPYLVGTFDGSQSQQHR